MKTFNDMTKAELLDVVEKMDLNDKLAEFGADPKKIKNSDIIELLEAFKEEQNKDKESGNSEPDEVAKDNPASRGEPMNIENMTKFLNTAIPVVVVDHESSIEVKDDTELRAVEVSWSNPILGCTTEKIYKHGQRQFLTRGVLKTMRTMFLPRTKIVNNKLVYLSPTPRFSITEVDGFTDAEWKALQDKEARAAING